MTYEVPASLREMAPPGLPRARLGAGTNWGSWTERQLTVQSPACFKLPVQASDQDKALTVAETTILPRMLAALSAVVGSPIYGMVMAFHRVGDPGGWLPRLSAAQVQVFGTRIRDATEMDFDDVARVLWAAELDHTARQAAADMAAANTQLHGHAGNAAEVRSTLLTYFFVIERIANRIDRFFPPRPTSDDTEPVIRSLEASLEELSDPGLRVGAVRKAATELRALHELGMWRRVKEAGRVLSISTTQLAEAQAFTTLRHKELGHVSPAGPVPDDILGWLPRAQATAHVFLSAYLRWVGHRGYAAPD